MDITTRIKLFLILRERLCDGDNPHPMRKYITVEEMEKLTTNLDSLYKG